MFYKKDLILKKCIGYEVSQRFRRKCDAVQSVLNLTPVSEGYTASIIRVKYLDNKVTTYNQTTSKLEVVLPIVYSMFSFRP